ncbi:MAG: OsmC family protein [Pseudomonadota bacterium]
MSLPADPQSHIYTSRIRWTGNRGTGTSSYRAYDRSWSIETPGKPVVSCSNDPLLGGDPSLHNPEDLLLATLSACHMLWYLHLASRAGIVVQDYSDQPEAIGEMDDAHVGRFIRATLRPHIVVPEDTDLKRADAIHYEISKTCFIARSVNFPVLYEASYQTGASTT